MRDRISSYKLSPQLRAELGAKRRYSKTTGKSLDMSFEFPDFLSVPKAKIPWKIIGITVFVALVIVGSYAGAKKTYELAKNKAYEAEQAKIKEYQNSLASIRSEISSQATDAYSFVTLSQKFLKEGNGEKAVAAAEMATEKDPLWRDGYLNLGQIYLSVNEFEKAKLALGQALEKDPTSGQAHYLMYLTLDELNSKDTAKQEYAKAKTFGFDSNIGG